MRGLLNGLGRSEAEQRIRESHYTHTIPSGKSYYVGYDEALVVWSIPANKNLARFLLGPAGGSVWELSRLWAPDDHAPNLLTQAISYASRILLQLERPDILVSYADPMMGHRGGVYRAASWIYHGQSTENRRYRAPNGQIVSRRAFHSGGRGLTKAEIQAMGFTEVRGPGKERFVKTLTRTARQALQRGKLDA